MYLLAAVRGRTWKSGSLVIKVLIGAHVEFEGIRLKRVNHRISSHGTRRYLGRDVGLLGCLNAGRRESTFNYIV